MSEPRHCPAGFGEDAARTALAHWNFGPEPDVSLLCISENATYLVRDPATGAQGVLRLNRPGYHSRAAIESELAWTGALIRGGVVDTPAVLPTRRGDRVAVLGAERHAVMFTFAPGSEPSPSGLRTLMPVIGAIAARLHAHGRRWPRPEGFSRFAWDLPAALGSDGRPGRWGRWRSAIEGDDVNRLGSDALVTLETAEAAVVTQLTEYGYDCDRFGLVHGDLRAANLLLDGDRLSVIDFDDCGMSWYGYDLAASVSFVEHQADLPELAAGYVQGYREVGELRSADVDVLPALIMLRRLQLLAWSGSHADTEMVRSLGPAFPAETVEVAERYLNRTLLAGLT